MHKAYYLLVYNKEIMNIKEILKKLMPHVGRDNEEPREKWLEEMLSNIPASSRILDAGAGTQRYRRYCEHLDYVAQDFAEYDGKGDDSALQTGDFDYGELDIVSDITSIPEADASFDAIMCIEVLEHLPDPVQAIKEFSRLLKPGGQLILTAPFSSLTHFAPYHFSSGFNTYWYKTHLTENNFDSLELIPNGNFFEFISQELWRVRFVADTYSNNKPNPLELLALFFVQRMFYRFSKNDTGSSELLCFGYHVVARKN